MNTQNSPENMITVEEFAKQKGLAADKVVAMIKDGIYVGRVVGDQWYVDPSELAGGNASPRSKPSGTAYESGTDYKTSILVAKLVSAVGWVTSVVAIVIVFSAFAAAGRMGALAIAPGLGVLIGGLILVIAGQSSRAVMDNANYSKLILEEMRKKA